MTVEQKSFNKADAERWYNEYRHIIEVGAYSENPPEDDEEYEDWEPDGSLWYGSVNLGEAIESLEVEADAEDLKFVSTTPYKANTKMTYILVPLTEKEKKERAERRAALTHAAIAAQFRWQDRNKIVLEHGGYVMGKLPGDQPAYVVEITAVVREDDSMMTYSWQEDQQLTVTWKEDGTPVIDDATEEQVKHCKLHGEPSN